ncbi:MAG: M3 family metallopeptidase [Xanthomonadales bacterium]|nr:M3 family metallopeptidase [Xanthomonadales bacterium]ODU92127.1 MAG: oligopeptidase A [Rhodanobacter sp. SCN 66-43]OJY86009.1 MAG: oligopeptidase A [Xanthomonadales bacterium 66-474]
MATDNPLLDDAPLPAFSKIRAADVGPAIDAILADYQAGIDAITAAGARRPQPSDLFDAVMLQQERLDQRLARAWSPVSHLHAVADSKELRAAYEEAEEKITDFASALGQNRDLHAAVQAVADAPDSVRLARPEHALIEHALRDFRLSGVALEEPARTRFRDIANELARLTTEFSNAVLDATDAWHEHIEDERDLAGIPESGRAVLREYARERELGGWLVTLKQPAVQAVLTYADKRSLRERVYWAYQTRASDQGPNAGKFDNSGRMEKILALRHEAAQLLGFANAAEESLATKMAKTPGEVLAFLRDLIARAKPVAQRELDELRGFARDELGLETLESWDVAYASEKLRLARYALDEEQLKAYFPLPSVLEGMFGVASRLYGIVVAPVSEGVDVWHPDVCYCEVRDAGGTLIAGVYLDLYARSGKRGGAWMDVCRDRFRDGDGVQLPIAFLTCNFAPPQRKTSAGGGPTSLARAAGEGGTTRGAGGGVREEDEVPSLLTHDDVQTIFHEFGHGLHHMLTRIDLPSIGGIDGVEWDAVELPSQFMENFCWNRQALDLFARHWSSGDKLPDELFDRMLAARHFQAGMFLCRQLEFGLFDFLLHADHDPARGARVLETLEAARREAAVLHPPAWQRFPHAFTHIFSGGYAAGYYSYLWAEVLSADAFGAFEERAAESRAVENQAGEGGGVIDAATGARFRDEFLSVGASRPALESFIAFRGRAPQPDALLKSYGLAA